MNHCPSKAPEVLFKKPIAIKVYFRECTFISVLLILQLQNSFQQQNQNSVAFLTDFWLVQVSNMVDIVSCFEKEPAVVARWHVGEERTFSCIPQLNYTVVGGWNFVRPQKGKYDALCFWFCTGYFFFEIDCAIFNTNLHELFCHFISWTK